MGVNCDDTKHSTCAVEPQWSLFLDEETETWKQQALGRQQAAVLNLKYVDSFSYFGLI